LISAVSWFSWEVHNRRLHPSWSKLRARAKPIFCVWSEWDEAMRGLGAQQLVKIDYVTPKSVSNTIKRSSQLVTLLSTIFLFVYIAASMFSPDDPSSDTYPAFQLLIISGSLFAISRVLWLCSLRHRWNGVCWICAKLLNRWLSRLAIGAAYGDDTGERLVAVAPTPPHGLVWEELRIARQEIGGMSPQKSARALGDTYRTIMGFDRRPLDPGDLWSHLCRALYHNAYFQDDEVVDALASRMDESSGGPPRPIRARKRAQISANVLK
jgi:hypothetical protein